jgi:hypothetical protein
MKVNGKYYPMYCGKQKCLKPPTSWVILDYAAYKLGTINNGLNGLDGFVHRQTSVPHGERF